MFAPKVQPSIPLFKQGSNLTGEEKGKQDHRTYCRVNEGAWFALCFCHNFPSQSGILSLFNLLQHTRAPVATSSCQTPSPPLPFSLSPFYFFSIINKYLSSSSQYLLLLCHHPRTLCLTLQDFPVTNFISISMRPHSSPHRSGYEAPSPSPEPNNDSQDTLRRMPARAPEPGDGMFAMSPMPGESVDYFSQVSSPEPLPQTNPTTRRGSAIDSSYEDLPTLSTFPSSVSQSQVSESVFSETSAAPFFEIDQKLQELVFKEEAEHFKKIPAANIPTDIPDELKHAPFTFDCAFGWTGNQDSDLEDIPKTKEAFLDKLAEAKQGTDFIDNALLSYQTEINSRRHHRFPAGFLSHQNNAIVVTNDQLYQINAQLDGVIREVKAIDDDGADIDDKLVEAYKHAAPWVKRTKRVLFDAHVFYKLNYTMHAKNKSVDKKKKKASLVSEFDTSEFDADAQQVEIPGSLRNGK